jgi:acetoacetyl-CoA synthetase
VDSGVLDGFTPWGELVADTAAECDFAPLPFDHPLWVLYSSGTTGLPKPIVHGHGGVLLEHHKSLGLHFDLRPGDRFFWYTSTSWIMWNILVAGLLHGATIVLYDGSPTYPSHDVQWALAAEHGVTFLGTGAAYVAGCTRAGLRPRDRHDLSAVRGIGVTGSPLPADAFRWVYDAVAPDVWLTSVSGGTDVATGFIKGAPVLPVHVGELQCRGLGVAMAAWDDGGRPVIDEVGELVVTEPMPSMPLYFWGDPEGKRYRESYFEMFPGVWRHGDFVTVTSRGTVVVHGRSDSTINRQGVRMGSADIYDAVERLPEVAESLVIGAELPDGGYYLPLFVVLAAGAVLDDDLRSRINDAIRTEVSPRHVPDEIIEAPGVPHTLTGKRIEVPIKRLLQGHPVEGAVNLGALDRPELIDFYAEFARRRLSLT